MLKEIVITIVLLLGVGCLAMACSVIALLVFSEELDRIIGDVEF